ncbi:hypothetical protein HPB52_023697 [Rhipicephalus sanguineus]|uniref:Uncharacterized protein n=1 Tax=Rhipicephalus sanguineus TaxID=34632 RepID=A0A9D4TC90_RHISA|nr:hypothetical protein HPB52_023697 [Rhipicephalus sanguineus]
MTPFYQGTPTLVHQPHLNHVGPSAPHRRKSAPDPLSSNFEFPEDLAFAVAFYTAVNNNATVVVIANFLRVWEFP